MDINKLELYDKMNLENIDKIRRLATELYDEVNHIGYEDSVVIGLIKKLNKEITKNEKAN